MPSRTARGPQCSESPNSRGSRGTFALGTVVALLVAAALMSPAPATALDPAARAPAPGQPPRCQVSPLLVPSCGVWWGATGNPLGHETYPQSFDNLEETVGRSFDIVHYYHSGTELFPTRQELEWAREPGARRLLFLAWKPEQGRTWAQVAAGDKAVDDQIDRLADHIRSTFPERFFLTIHHEPEEEVRGAGSGFTAKDYAGMFRHVILRLRARGVDNIVSVMNYMGTPAWGSQSWFNDLYPGDDVVDWIAEDPYIFGNPPVWWSDFAGAVNRQDRYLYPNWPGFYGWAQQRHPDKPIMLAEWGVDERRPVGDESSKPEVLESVQEQIDAFPEINALVYWNSNDVGTVGETRVDSSPLSLAAFKDLGRQPMFNVPIPPR